MLTLGAYLSGLPWPVTLVVNLGLKVGCHFGIQNGVLKRNLLVTLAVMSVLNMVAKNGRRRKGTVFYPGSARFPVFPEWAQYGQKDFVPEGSSGPVSYRLDFKSKFIGCQK